MAFMTHMNGAKCTCPESPRLTQCDSCAPHHDVHILALHFSFGNLPRPPISHPSSPTSPSSFGDQACPSRPPTAQPSFSATGFTTVRTNNNTGMASGKGNSGPAFPQALDSTSVSYQNSEDTPLVVVGMGATHGQHVTSGSSSTLEMELEGSKS
jgi:hypothetical protein